MQSLGFLPISEVDMPFEARILELSHSVFNHGALNNKFYDLWRERRFSKDEFRVFSINYFARVHATTYRISLALTSIDDWVSRIEILNNLSDELGHGVNENVHVLVLCRWFNSLGLKLGLEEFVVEYKNHKKLILSEKTTQFINETNGLCASGKMEACGALLAQEWHGYSQLGLLHEGFRNYIDMYELDDFHDVGEYFYVHLGRAEKEHKLQANKIAGRNCQSKEEFEILKVSFNRYLGLLEEFWNAMYSDILKEPIQKKTHNKKIQRTV